MGGRSSRVKGAAGEREACGLLTDWLGGQTVRRRLGQSREGGHDATIDMGGGREIRVEVKRQEQARLHLWLEQAEASCEGTDAMPLVIWRPSRRPWIACAALPDMCYLVREAMGGQDDGR